MKKYVSGSFVRSVEQSGRGREVVEGKKIDNQPQGEIKNSGGGYSV